MHFTIHKVTEQVLQKYYRTPNFFVGRLVEERRVQNFIRNRDILDIIFLVGGGGEVLRSACRCWVHDFTAHNMKAGMGAQVHFHSFLTSVLDGGEWLNLDPGNLTPRKKHRFQRNMRLGRRQSQSGRIWRKEKSLTLTEVQNPFCPACSLDFFFKF